MNMTPKPDPAIDTAIAALTQGRDLRVWSLIVTLFGDMARAPGARLSGAQLSLITGRIGIRPEAMRVALHRLRKDGWIESKRVGRASHYALTPFGRDQTQQAAKRIYAGTVDTPDSWHIVLAEPMAQADRAALEQQLVAKGYVTLTPTSYLGKGPAPAAPSLMAINGQIDHVPDWLKHTLMPDRLMQDCAHLEKRLKAALKPLARPEELTALDAAALRILVVHAWRRVLLRQADLPDAFFPVASRGPACRQMVQHILGALPQQAPEISG